MEVIDLGGLKIVPLYSKNSKLHTKVIPTDENIVIAFDRLKLNKEFQKIIKIYKTELGIPANWFETMGEANVFFRTEKIGESNKKIRMFAYSKYIIKEFKLNNSFRWPVQIYLQYGDLVPLFTDAGTNFSGGIEYHDDGVYIKIFPEATARGLKRLIDDNFNRVKETLKFWHPKETTEKRMKKLTTKNRDSKIFELFETGVFKSDGATNLKKMYEYFQKFGIVCHNLKEYFKQLGFNLPGIEMRKRIIIKYKKLKKLAM